MSDTFTLNHIIMSRVTLTLDNQLADKLREVAKRDDRPMSSVARIAFASYFAKLPKRGLTIRKGAKV